MAQNKNAQIRYKALDKCFSNRYKKFYINDLIDYCSGVLTEHYAQETTVSRRQIFDDMDFMRSEAGSTSQALQEKKTLLIKSRQSAKNLEPERQ